MCAVRVYDERAPSRLRVATVVLFYMSSALVVRLLMISRGPQSRTLTILFSRIFVLSSIIIDGFCEQGSPQLHP